MRTTGSTLAALVLAGGLLAAPAPPTPAEREAAELLVLQRQARNGSPDALAALAAKPTPEATKALLSLVDTSDKEQLRRVLAALDPRLPVPAYPGRECPFTLLATKERRELSAKAWVPALNKPARDFAKHLLTQTDRELAGRGARLLTCVGDLDDTPALVAAMDRLLAATADPDAKPGYMPAWFDDFLMASQGMTYRGLPAPAAPKTPGEIVIYLNRLSTHRDDKPADRRARCQGWLDHPVPYVRHLARLQLAD